MEKVQVVAAVICRDNKFLLGKRATYKKSAPGYWSPISGQIEVGETEEQAVVREVFEEVDLKVSPVSKIFEFDTNDGSSRLHWWLVKIESGKAILKNDEHSEIRWLTIDEMKQLDSVFQEDIELYEKLHKEMDRL